MEDLKQTMNQLTEELNNSVNATVTVTASTGTTSDKILQTQSRMQLLKDSMQKISDMSMEIEKIIGEIIGSVILIKIRNAEVPSTLAA